MKARRYLTHSEVLSILDATMGHRHQIRDYAMIVMGFLHGFRVSELTSLKLSDIDIESRSVFIRRLKNGFCTIHPLQPHEVDALTKWLAIRQGYLEGQSDWLFVTQRGLKLSRQRFYTLFKKYGYKAGLTISAHPHMLRHACGFELAEQGMDTRLIQDYLGHRNIHHTILYTASNSSRFSRVWKQNNFRHDIEVAEKKQTTL
ncbi:tyrosine-type recombinase/integrase [Enterobacter cloacae]|nr:tyrosine-type recombinase/integrase [Enterobacter cloacae]